MPLYEIQVNGTVTMGVMENVLLYPVPALRSRRPVITLDIYTGQALSIGISRPRPSMNVNVTQSMPGVIQRPRPVMALDLVLGRLVEADLTVFRRPIVTLDMLAEQQMQVRISHHRPVMRLNATTGQSLALVYSRQRPVATVNMLTGQTLKAMVSRQRPSMDLYIGVNTDLQLTVSRQRPVLGLSVSVPLIEIYRTWLINAKTKGHARYENFPFIGFGRYRGQYYGITRTGLYLLNSDKDNGVEISARVKTGVSDLGSPENKRVTNAWINTRCNGDLSLKLTANETVEMEYPVIASDGEEGFHNKRVWPAQGIVGQVWQAEISNVDGDDFELDYLELAAVNTGRR